LANIHFAWNEHNRERKGKLEWVCYAGYGYHKGLGRDICYTHVSQDGVGNERKRKIPIVTIAIQ